MRQVGDIALCIQSYDEERGRHFLLLQDIKDLWRVCGIGPIVEGEDYF